jgi:two-component system NtrC family sensor kinase
LTSIIEKRRSLNNQVETKERDNIRLQLQIDRMQALANIGTATCMIAHELNNLLTPLSSYAELAMKNPHDHDLCQKALQKTSKNSRRAREIMQSILAVANGHTREAQSCNLKALISEIFNCLCRDFSKDAITVNVDVPDDLTVWAVGVEIQQVLMNLILNARDAMIENGGILTISATENADSVRIQLTDTGCGIAPENIDNIFEPFFSTKSDSDSSQTGSYGLGLAFCKSVIEELSGSIDLDSAVSRGTTFTITLPINK